MWIIEADPTVECRRHHFRREFDHRHQHLELGALFLQARRQHVLAFGIGLQIFDFGAIGLVQVFEIEREIHDSTLCM